MIPVANANLGPRYAVQVGLVAALNTNLDDSNMEMQDLREQQDEDRREIKRLKALIAGQDEEEAEEDEERWPAMSPRPRRTSYG
jgi:capsule polysaccharide export protein KpsE/RkpR